MRTHRALERGGPVITPWRTKQAASSGANAETRSTYDLVDSFVEVQTGDGRSGLLPSGRLEQG